MSVVYGNVLGAADLTSYRLRTEQELPEKGPREYQPSNSWLENEQLASALQERFQLIAEERVCRLGTLARAEWDEQIKEALVTRVVGRHWQLFGHERKTRIWLYPEEALFLVESGCLELMLNGVAVSIQQAYCVLLCPNTNCTLNEYRTYAHLLRHGYRVLRHTASAKSVSSGSCTVQKNERVCDGMEIVEISESKPRPSPSSSITEIPTNIDTHGRNQLLTSGKATSLSQRKEFPCVESDMGNVDLKPVLKVPTDESDITLVYENKGPVIQGCLKPKGSLVLFPDSHFESQSSSRTANVMPIDIDDNELEISYVDRNVSVTLSPQKKENKGAQPSARGSVTHTDVEGEVAPINVIKESSAGRSEVGYEEQSTTVEDSCSSLEGNLKSKTRVSVNGSNAGNNSQIAEVSSDSDSNNACISGTVEIAQHSKNVGETSKTSPLPVKNTGSSNVVTSVTSNNRSGDLATNNRGINSSGISTSQTVASVLGKAATIQNNLNNFLETMSVSERAFIADKKSFKTGSVALDDTGKQVPSDDVVVVETNGSICTAAMKNETEDIIEIQENSDNVLCRKTVNNPNTSNVEMNTKSKEINCEWQQKIPKKEDADIEIICDASQLNIPISGKVNSVNCKQSTETNNYGHKQHNTLGIDGKQFLGGANIKPDLEILSLHEESDSTASDFVGDQIKTAARKRLHDDVDMKEECPSAKKQLINSNNWSQDDTETDDTKPCSSQQINVINLEDDEARLTLVERRAVLDAIPSIENKFTIHVQAPKQEFLPPNVKPKQKDYYIQLWRLKADGFGGGPGQNNSNDINYFPMSQPGQQNQTRPENNGRINPWLPSSQFRPQPPPLLGFGNGFLPHPMFAQALMMAQSLAMAQSMAMNFNYHQMQQRFFRGRYMHRPYFRRGYKRRYNSNIRNPPYHRNQGQSNNFYNFSRNSANDESSDSQSRPQSTTTRTENVKTTHSKNMQVVIDIEDDSNDKYEKMGKTGDSDDDVIECYEVAKYERGGSRDRRRRSRGRLPRPRDRYFAPFRRLRQQTEKMWQEERSDVEEISVVGAVNRLRGNTLKREQENIEVTLSSDDELLDDSMSVQGLMDVMVEDSTGLVSCLQPENCRSVDTVLSRLQIFQQGKKPRNLLNAVSRKQLRIAFDLYLPSMSFRKTTPGLPDYRIIVFSQEQSVSSYEQSMPTLGDIAWVLKDFDDCVPLLLARVEPDTIQFTLFAKVELPVAPGIVCDVL